MRPLLRHKIGKVSCWTHVQSWNSCLVVKMESVTRVLENLEKEVIQELHIISGLSTENNEITKAVDNILLSVSSGITQVKVMVGNKRRFCDQNILTDNQFIKIDKQIAVYILGKESNPRSTVAVGHASVVWNQKHSLNTCFKNPLTVISRNSSENLAFLALVNQANEINIKSIALVVNTPYIKNLYENIHLYHAQNYTLESGISMLNDFVLRDIYNAICKNNIKISFYMASDIDNELCNMLKNTAKEMIKTI